MNINEQNTKRQLAELQSDMQHFTDKYGSACPGDYDKRLDAMQFKVYMLEQFITKGSTSPVQIAYNTLRTFGRTG